VALQTRLRAPPLLTRPKSACTIIILPPNRKILGLYFVTGLVRTMKCSAGTIFTVPAELGTANYRISTNAKDTVTAKVVL
jgi:hypothetical protein